MKVSKEVKTAKYVHCVSVLSAAITSKTESRWLLLYTSSKLIYVLNLSEIDTIQINQPILIISKDIELLICKKKHIRIKSFKCLLNKPFFILK